MQIEDLKARLDALRHKRVKTLCGAYQMMAAKYKAVAEGTWLHEGLVAATVENYLRDYAALVGRYNIPGRIAKHKVAGLMAASILKYRPVQLVEDEGAAARISKDNEELAFLHGLAICAEGHGEQSIKSLLTLANFHIWHEDLVYLFRRRPDSAECFSMVFETLSLTYFPKNLATGPWRDALRKCWPGTGDVSHVDHPGALVGRRANLPPAELRNREGKFAVLLAASAGGLGSRVAVWGQAGGADGGGAALDSAGPSALADTGQGTR